MVNLISGKNLAKRVAPLRLARRNESVDGRHTRFGKLTNKKDIMVIMEIY